MACDHNPSLAHAWITEFSIADIYQCPCGALVNYSEPRNLNGSPEQMNPQELAVLLQAEKNNTRKQLLEATRK